MDRSNIPYEISFTVCCCYVCKIHLRKLYFKKILWNASSKKYPSLLLYERSYKQPKPFAVQ